MSHRVIPHTARSLAEQDVRIFVSEFICGGSLAGDPLPDSLRREGRAMLWAIVDDLLRVPECEVTTTLDARLADETRSRSSVRCDIVTVTESSEERRLFNRLAATSDAVLVIAPETDCQLAERVRRVESLGTRTLNCLPEAIELCGDKLRLTEHLERHALATIPTARADWSRNQPPQSHHESWVVKPRDGAGSWLTFRIRADSCDEWQCVALAYEQAGVSPKALIQPFVAGLPLSVGCLCQSNGDVEIFPIGRQRLSNEFVYQGGSIPADIPPATEIALRKLVLSTCATIPGLSGYIGFDLLLPEANPSRPLIVEINPRLTTSYVGYRLLSANNLAERWLRAVDLLPNSKPSPPNWSSDRIEFDSNGVELSRFPA
ncbi:MAG: ATP-grasp domain-containing protein [Planctomycetota bacterium]